MNPSNTVFDAKRLIGRNYKQHRSEIEADVSHWPFDVVEDKSTNQPMIRVQYMGDSKKFKPEQISAMVLEKMKGIAEEYSGKDVSKALLLFLLISMILKDKQQKMLVLLLDLKFYVLSMNQPQ